MKLTYRIKITLLSFIVTFTTFLCYLILENVFWINKLKVEQSISFKAGRVLIGLSFAMISATFVWFAMNLFYKSLRKLGHTIQNMSADMDTDSWEDDESAVDELGELTRALRISLYQQKIREKEYTGRMIDLVLNDSTNDIFQLIHKSEIGRIDGFDISLVPKTGKSPKNDFINVIQTADGLIGIMAGYPEANIQGNALKARIEGIMTLAGKSPHLPGNELLQNILDSIRVVRHNHLNLTLFFIDKIRSEISYLNLQENDLMLFDNGNLTSPGTGLTSPGTGLTSLETRHGSYLDINHHEDYLFNKAPLNKGACIIAISDRILSSLDLNSGSLKHKLKGLIHQPKNTREMAMQILQLVRGNQELMSQFGMLLIRIK